MEKMARTHSQNLSLRFPTQSNEAAEKMMGTRIPNGSTMNSVSGKENEAGCMNESIDSEEGKGECAQNSLLRHAKPPSESFDFDRVSSSLRGCKRLALALSLAAFLASFAVLLYVIVMIAIQVSHRKQEKNTATTDKMQAIHPEVCLDCERLIQNPYTQPGDDTVLQGLTRREEGNVMKCCARSYRQMSVMLKLVARRQDTKKSENSSSVVVHKQMISGRTDSSAGMKGYHVVEFDGKNNKALSEQCLGAKNNGHGIVVVNSGTYYVYSNVLFNDNRAEKTSSKQTWTSNIHLRSRQSKSRTGILLTAVHRPCPGCTQDKLSSFTGGVFQLYSGDLIQVFLSNGSVIEFNKVSSYLGLVMINGQ